MKNQIPPPKTIHDLPDELYLQVGKYLPLYDLVEGSGINRRFRRVFREIIPARRIKDAQAIHNSLLPPLQSRIPVNKLIAFAQEYPKINLTQFMRMHYPARDVLAHSEAELLDPSVLIRSKDINDAALVLLRMFPRHTPHRPLPRYDALADRLQNEENDTYLFFTLFTLGVLSLCMTLFFIVDLYETFGNGWVSEGKDKGKLGHDSHIFFILFFTATSIIKFPLRGTPCNDFKEKIDNFIPTNHAEKEYHAFLKTIYQECTSLWDGDFLALPKLKKLRRGIIGLDIITSPAQLYGIFLYMPLINTIALALYITWRNLSRSKPELERISVGALACDMVCHMLLSIAAFMVPFQLLIRDDGTHLTEAYVNCGPNYCPAEHTDFILATTAGTLSTLLTGFVYETIYKHGASTPTYVVETVSNATHSAVNYLYNGLGAARRWMGMGGAPELDIEAAIAHRMN